MDSFKKNCQFSLFRVIFQFLPVNENCNTFPCYLHFQVSFNKYYNILLKVDIFLLVLVVEKMLSVNINNDIFFFLNFH